MNHDRVFGSEKPPTPIHSHAGTASAAAATEIGDLIRTRAVKGKSCVKGLAKWSAPTGVYAALVPTHQEPGLCFANLLNFNLDLYLPMQPHEIQSDQRLIQEYLFQHIDIRPENRIMPDRTLPIGKVAEYEAIEGFVQRRAESAEVAV